MQGGLGFGVNKNRLIFVFANEQVLRNFIDQGWEFGAQANVSAMAGGSGGMYTGAANRLRTMEAAPALRAAGKTSASRR